MNLRQKFGCSKESEKIYGYITGENNMPFIYSDGILSILPSSIPDWENEKSKLFKSFGRFYNRFEHKWIENKSLKGITSSGSEIEFLTSGDGSNTNGFVDYEIQRYFEFNPQKISSTTVDGLYIQCEENSFFLNPGEVFTCNTTFDSERLKEISVSTSEEKKLTLGKFILSNDIEITVYIRALATLHTLSDTPFTANSEIIVEASNEIDLETANDIVWTIKRWFYYICYRSNVVFRKITTYKKIDNLRYQEGKIVYYPVTDEENHPKRNRKLLSSKVLNCDMSSLFQSIYNNEIYFEHMCHSISDRNRYDTGRIVLIFTAFEREYENLYGNAIDHSENYYEVKASILDYITDLINKKTGKTKKHLNKFYKIINNSDDSFSQRVNYALNDCFSILEAFLSFDYANEEEIKNIADRINEIRNDIVHGNIGFKLEPIHVTDLQMLEKLVYAARMKSIGIPENCIKQGLVDLFGYPIYIEPEGQHNQQQ